MTGTHFVAAASIIPAAFDISGTAKHYVTPEARQRIDAEATAKAQRHSDALAMVGEEFGRLLVLRIAHHAYAAPVLLVECSCLTTFLANADAVRNEWISRCGECAEAFRKRHGEAP